MKSVRPIILGGAGAVGAVLLLALSGLIDVAATPRPVAIAQWLFDTAVRQSVTLRSIGIKAPPLDEPRMIRRGAAHYDLVCATCHGSPSRPPAAIARSMTPRPPPMIDQMEQWRPPARIFWTVKHGIRHSAMPAWPDQRRDDEIWAMVAFLRQMTDMSGAHYTELTGGQAQTVCARCHGEHGEGRDGAFPRLDIQSPGYIAATLRAFRDRSRASGTMAMVAHGLTDDAIDALAARYGRRNAARIGDTDRGAEIARVGIPERKVPACDSCHGERAREDYPRLHGQETEYLLNQLRLFSELGVRRGGRYAEIMAQVVRGLNAEDMEALAAWYGR